MKKVWKSNAEKIEGFIASNDINMHKWIKILYTLVQCMNMHILLLVVKPGAHLNYTHKL